MPESSLGSSAGAPGGAGGAVTMRKVNEPLTGLTLPAASMAARWTVYEPSASGLLNGIEYVPPAATFAAPSVTLFGSRIET